MLPLTVFRSARRPLLALLVVGGLMSMSPVAALPTSGLLGDDAPLNLDSALSEPTDLVGGALGGDLLGGDLPAGDLVGGVLGGDLLGADLPAGDLVGGVLGGDLPTGDLLGGDLLGGDLPAGDLLGGDLLGGGLPTGDLLGGNAGSDDPQASSSGVNDPGGADNGISIAGIHIGMKGHMNSIEELTDPCDSLRGRIHTGIQGADLTLAKALPAPTSCPDPAPPVSNPGPPGTHPGTDVLPVALESAGPRSTTSPYLMAVPAPMAAGVPAQPVFDPAVAGPSSHHTALPRTGPGGLFQGPFALALLGFSGALRAVIRRRRPELS